MIRRVLGMLFVVAVVLTAAPARAITNGQPDGGEHPYVGELLFFDADDVDSRFDDPGGWFSCTGTLVSPTVVLTAGHCTFGVGKNGQSTRTDDDNGSGGNDMWVTFDEMADFEGFPASADYDRDENQQRYEDRAAFLDGNPAWHSGTAFPHPEFDEVAFFVHDAGVVVLDEPISAPVYGAVPAQDYLTDTYAHRPKNTHRFEVVGYGLTQSGPHTSVGDDARRKADVKLDSLGGSPKLTFILLSNNKGKVHRGGTCFGDSGGPTFDDTSSNLVVAVTSFGSSSTCSGTGGAYRIDQPDDLEFLAEFGIEPATA